MKKILLINANYYKDITDELEKAAYQILKKKNLKSAQLLLLVFSRYLS